jgi:hypothetical protein
MGGVNAPAAGPLTAGAFTCPQVTPAGWLGFFGRTVVVACAHRPTTRAGHRPWDRAAPTVRSRPRADGPGWYPNICSHTISAVGTWEADAPAYSRPIAAPLERCAELLGVDLTTVRRATASIEPYIRVDGTRSGASCNWSDASGPRHTGESAAATSAVDGVHQSTARPESAWKVQRKG